MNTFRLITDPEEAKKIWYEISPKKVIDDEWKFREEFRRYYNYDHHFVASFKDNKLVGLLPLQYNTDKKELEVYGGDDTDDNKILVKPGFEQQKKELLHYVKKPAFLAPLAEPYQYKKQAEFYEYKYFLDLDNFKSYEDYLDQYWSGKSRRELRRQIKKLYKEHKIELIENDYSDLELLFEFNTKRFGEQSSFHDPIRRKIFKEFITMYQVEMLTLKIDDKKEAVSYAIKYHDTYLSMNMGANYEINGIGKLLILLQINKAIHLGCRLYDAGKGDSGWKEMFKFSKVPQYKLNLDLS